MNASDMPLALFNLGWEELVLIGVLGVLLFGRRLPDMGKSLGKTIVEFKKGLSAAGEEISKGAEEEKPEKSRPALRGKDGQQVKRIASGGEEP